MRCSDSDPHFAIGSARCLTGRSNGRLTQPPACYPHAAICLKRRSASTLGITTKKWAIAPLTKLDHSRPFLRYIDSVRREIARQNRMPLSPFPDLAKRATPVSETAIFPLTAMESKVSSRLLTALEDYIEAESLAIQAIAPGAAKSMKAKAKAASKDLADAHLQTAATAFAAQAVFSLMDGRRNLANLYSSLESELKSDSYFLWDHLNNQVMPEAIFKIDSATNHEVRNTQKDLAEMAPNKSVQRTLDPSARPLPRTHGRVKRR